MGVVGTAVFVAIAVTELVDSPVIVVMRAALFQ